MGQSFYVYNNGDLRRKDNTLRFTSSEGEKRDIPIERIDDTYRNMGYLFISLIIIIFIPEAFIQKKNCLRVSYW